MAIVKSVGRAPAHTASHRRTLSVAPSGVASKIGDASTAWR